MVLYKPILLSVTNPSQKYFRADCSLCSCSTKGVSLRGRTNNEAIMAALKETLRYGLFVGTFAGVFCTVDETVAAIGGCHRFAHAL